MPSNSPNLDWLRNANPTEPGYSARLYELLDAHRQDLNILEQQANANLNGTPQAPPAIQSFRVVPHPQGVQFEIRHDVDFYQGIKYEIDATSGNVTHSYDVGSSRNGVLPVGNLHATYQVRAMYPTGQSTSPLLFRNAVTGGGGSTTLLPSQGSGTTKQSQPPGFGGPYRGSKPPSR